MSRSDVPSAAEATECLEKLDEVCEILLGELFSSPEDVVQVVFITAYLLWRIDKLEVRLNEAQKRAADYRMAAEMSRC